MVAEYELPIVLPPLGPVFASSESSMTLLAYESEEQREQSEEDMARYFGVPLPRCIRRTRHIHEEVIHLRTPTSGHLLSTSFPPSTSPIKKDSASSKTTFPLLQLQLDSPTHTDGSNETEHSSEDEKLRVSRERNRLHAQRTRIRKRELLESLRERIKALEDEFELLKQAYDFHTTAVCLLRLGQGHDVSFVLQLEQVSGIKGMEERDKEGCRGESSKTIGLIHDSDCDEEMYEHEKDWDLKDDDDVCAQLNANGTRPYLSTDAVSNVLVCSKEERERVRRERNRLHARRARLRKKLVLEKSQQAVHDLRVRNDRLRSRLSALVSSIYGSETCLDDPDAMS